MERDSIIEGIEAAFQAMLDDKSGLDQLLDLAKAKNAWFDRPNLEFNLSEWSKILTTKDLSDWVASYSFTDSPKKIGIIMAGNVPMVGLHDLLCVLLSGHHAKVKLSSDDAVLIPHFVEKITEQNKALGSRIEFVERVKEVDAIIATGSNNTARYFQAYFGHLPNIIRKNRTSVAIISGEETKEELRALGRDIYTYFGLGCRNVSALLIPNNYDLSDLLYCLEEFVTVMDHHKYANNYTYHKAIWLMDNVVHYDNGFMCFKEERNVHAPLSTLYYYRYKDKEEISKYVSDFQEDIQCVVGVDSHFCEVKPGESQSPQLTDYADKIDVLDFLSKL